MTPRRAAASPQKARRPFRDNPRLILAGIVVLLGVLVALLAIANGSSRFSPDFLSEFVLYALSAADLTMLAALVFVLARNVVKLIVERRRGLPFARFRAKLVLLLLGMTFIPAVLVLLVGSELIRTSIERWFNAPMDEILSSANTIASDYYHERQMFVTDHAKRMARELSAVDLRTTDVRRIRDLLAPDVTLQRVQLVAVYRVQPTEGTLPGLEPVVDVAAPALPPGYNRASADRLAAQALSGSAATSIEPLSGAGELLHAAAIIRTKDGRTTGVVVATDYLTGEMASQSRRITQQFESYNQLRVLKRPLTGVYLASFLALTLMILVGATWMGLYMAKRITGPFRRSRRRRGKSARATWISGSSPRARTNSGRSWKRSTSWRASFPRRGVAWTATRLSWSASTSRSKRGGATSRRFWNASPRVSSRWTVRATSRRSTARRPVCWGLAGTSSASRPRRCWLVPISSRSQIS